MTESKEKLALLAERLLTRTREGTVSWDETDIPDYFATTLQGGSVRVGRESQGTYALEVSNDRGTLLDEVVVQPPNIVTVVLKGATQESDKTLSRVVPPLHELVRRQALNVDATLNSLLDQLS